MKSYGPTPLARIGNSILLDMQIDSIKRVFSDFEVIVCGGFEAEKVVRHIRDEHKDIDVRFVENQIHYNSNCCESLRLALNNIQNDKILICNGEIILNDYILELIDIKRSFIMSEAHNNPSLEVGIIKNEHGNVENLCYGIDQKWSEIMFLNNKDIVESFRRIVSSVDYKNKFIFEAINELVKTKHRVGVVLNDVRPVIKLGNIKTYHEVRKIYARTNTKLFQS